jgi:hypothetical protein
VNYAIFRVRFGLLGMGLCCLLGPLGCKDEDPCDPGWVAIDTGCWPEEQGGTGGTSSTPAPEAGANGEAGAPSAGGGGSDVEPPGNPNATFGTECTTNAECGGDAPTCLTDPLNYCSIIDCEAGERNEAGCPEGWQCFKYEDNPSACVNF